MLKAFNWLNWYNAPFSTSKRRGVFMDTALELLPPDYWRWYLTANAPEHSDKAFTWEREFQSAANRDLADVLGNFVNRILKFCETRFEGRVPAGGAPGPLEQKLYADVAAKLADITAQFEAIEIRKTAWWPCAPWCWAMSTWRPRPGRRSRPTRNGGGGRANGAQPDRPLRPGLLLGDPVHGQGHGRGCGREPRAGPGRGPTWRLNSRA